MKNEKSKEAVETELFVIVQCLSNFSPKFVSFCLQPQTKSLMMADQYCDMNIVYSSDKWINSFKKKTPNIQVFQLGLLFGKNKHFKITLTSEN